MNIKEFEALTPGDRIDNGNGQVGTVTATNPGGVHVRWGDSPSSPSFHIARMSTVWYGFDVVKPEGADNAGVQEA
jgi:hypothetical protein